MAALQMAAFFLDVAKLLDGFLEPGWGFGRAARLRVVGCDFVNQLSLGGGGGLVLVEKLLDVALVGFEGLIGQDGGLGGETMAQGVAGGTLLARFGARTGGVLGVGAVGGGATL